MAPVVVKAYAHNYEGAFIYRFCISRLQCIPVGEEIYSL